ncbi:hypothetical protein LUR56_16970 [Streptomyces sp. MT29]|nr:hypothetical protein [Streptomyces sp. MT29]
MSPHCASGGAGNGGGPPGPGASSGWCAEVDEGYRGLANEFPDQVSAPPKKPKDDAPLGEHHAWREQRRRQSSARICVEHTNAECKQWRPLQRFRGRRETYPETHPRSPPWSPTAPPGGRPAAS